MCSRRCVYLPVQTLPWGKGPPFSPCELLPTPQEYTCKIGSPRGRGTFGTGADCSGAVPRAPRLLWAYLPGANPSPQRSSLVAPALGRRGGPGAGGRVGDNLPPSRPAAGPGCWRSALGNSGGVATAIRSKGRTLRKRRIRPYPQPRERK